MVRELFWVGTTRDDIRALPESVRIHFGFALRMAQQGLKHPDAKPLQGFGSAGVLEVVEVFDGSAFRAVYTVRLKKGIYVLHVFQKKSKSGIKTPLTEIETIRRRLKAAADLDAQEES